MVTTKASSGKFFAVLKVGSASFLAAILALTVISTVVSATDSIDMGQARSLAPALRIKPSALVPFTYAQSTVPGVPVFARPSDETTGIAPIRTLGNGFVWFSLADPKPILFNQSLWYSVNPDGFVRAEHVKPFQPSTFRGINVTGIVPKQLAWIVFGVRASSGPGLSPAKNSPFLAKYSLVTILEEKKVGQWTWYKVGSEQWIEQRQLGIVRPSPRPEQVPPNEKWIEVNLYEQTLAAYEGDRMVYATLVSSGLPQWPTPPGLFQIWAKVKQSKMSGREGFPDYYYLEDVPWILYFNKEVALHGAYWHDRFGSRRSHGCVNLSPADAKWLYEWASPRQGPSNWTLSKPDNPGTWVWVH